VTPEFAAFPKIARLNRDIMITEKLDGTNAAIGVLEDGTVYAQSRTRLITPQQDNMGFAAWVEKNADILRLLGPGLHFGEWWGVGIQRGYGLTERRFSLFNATRWLNTDGKHAADYNILREINHVLPAITVVPVLYEGPWHEAVMDAFVPKLEVERLKINGSQAAPGYNRPEGIVVYHKASNFLFKVTCEKDEKPKMSQEQS
jgi:hypothetical protein